MDLSAILRELQAAAEKERVKFIPTEARGERDESKAAAAAAATVVVKRRETKSIGTAHTAEKVSCFLLA